MAASSDPPGAKCLAGLVRHDSEILFARPRVQPAGRSAGLPPALRRHGSDGRGMSGISPSTIFSVRRPLITGRPAIGIVPLAASGGSTRVGGAGTSRRTILIVSVFAS